MNTMTNLKFEVVEGIVVADPCYLEDARLIGRDDCVFTDASGAGTWYADVEISNEGVWGERVSALSAHRSDFGPTISTKFAHLGVDSGQMGIFPLESANVDYEGLLAWYEENGWDAKFLEFSGGVISSTGFGDGCYECRVDYDAQGLSKVTVTFIDDEEEEEEWIDEHDEEDE